MSSFSLNGAKPVGNYNRTKLPPGIYDAIVRDIRLLNGYKGTSFFIDCEVAEGPQKGMQFSYGVFPDQARPTAKLSVMEVRARELGKIQYAMAAVYGHSEPGVIDDNVFNASIAAKGKPSILRGARIRVESVAHTNQQGKDSSYYKVFPHPEGNGLDVKGPDPKTAPQKVPTQDSRPSFEEAAEAAGWKTHPEDSNYMFNEAEERVVLYSVVQAELGY